MSQKINRTQFLRDLRDAVRAEGSAQHHRISNDAWKKVENSLDALLISNIPKFSRDQRLDPIGPGFVPGDSIGLEADPFKMTADKGKEVLYKVQEHEISEAHALLSVENVPLRHPDDEGTMIGFPLTTRIKLLIEQKEKEYSDNLQKHTKEACSKAFRHAAARFDGDHYLWPTAAISKWLRGRAQAFDSEEK